jgi:hypothetical protein
MSYGFPANTTVIKDDEIYVVLTSNMIHTTVKTLDGTIETLPTEELESFTVPSAV